MLSCIGSILTILTVLTLATVLAVPSITLPPGELEHSPLLDISTPDPFISVSWICAILRGTGMVHCGKEFSEQPALIHHLSSRRRGNAVWHNQRSNLPSRFLRVLKRGRQIEQNALCGARQPGSCSSFSCKASLARSGIGSGTFSSGATGSGRRRTP